MTMPQNDPNSTMNVQPTPASDVIANKVEETPHVPEHAVEEPYKPVFNDTVRTIIYVVCGIIGALGAVCTIVAAAVSAPIWVTVASAVCAFVAPYVANMFGVAYNPVRMADK